MDPSKEVDVGTEAGLRFQLRWLGHAAGTAAEATRGELTAWIGDTLVWGDEDGGEPRGVEWSWVELLQFLAHAWPRLEWEQSNPLGLQAFPDELRVIAERRWRDQPASKRDREEHVLFAYEELHNLGNALQGLLAEPLWIQREGNCAWIIGQSTKLWRPWTETAQTLEQIAEAVFERLKLIKSEPRARAAMEGWRRRRQVPLDTYVSLATGLDTGTLDDMRGKRTVSQLFSIERVGEENEILAAARMIGTALPLTATRKVFERIGKVPLRQTPVLDGLAGRAGAILDEVLSEAPHDQGTTLARWLRAELGLDLEKRVDPADLLAQWDIPVIELDLEVSSVDALGCWGPRHGPAVLLNRSGRHCRSVAGRNATLAHEICHLLVDRAHALPLAEVMGGRLPPIVEQRARAFAAELLVPKEVARDIAAAPRNGLSREVERVARRYRASKELVAWQVRNSGVEIPASHNAYLRSLVREPWRF